MKNHNILLVPLSSGSGIRVKILEGMAMGMCIITTSIGASGLPVENNRHLLIEDNPEQFARAIYQLHGNPGMRKEISDNARKLVAENFDTFAVASRLGDFYTKLA